MMREIPFTKKEKWAQGPVRESTARPGFGLYNLYSTTLHNGVPADVPTGIALSPLESRVLYIMGRPNSRFNKNIKIESDFVGEGEINLKCTNYGECSIEIDPLTKMTECVLLKVSGGDPVVCENLDETVRGTKGFGSTGKK